jgi:signal transduction histidine kinase
MTESSQRGAPRAGSLTEAIIALGRELELPAVLDKMLLAAIDNTGAPFAAINVLDDKGISIEFHYKGMDSAVWERIGRAPNSVGVLAQIPATGALVISEITEHPSFRGLPPGHPPLGSFLGAALRTRNEVFGYLYLASKAGGFTPEDEAVVAALAAAASVAIENAQLYEEALEREEWLAASQLITTTLLANPGDESAIGGIIATARTLGRAASAALVLPGLGDDWVMEFTDGHKADELLGQVLPDDGFAMSVIRSGQGTVAPVPPGPSIIDPVQDFGPTLYAPLRAGERTEGLLMLWRAKGAPVFDDHDLTIAQRFSNQAAVALQLAELAHVRNMESLLAERERIADDLHDFVSQELFATAMQLEAVAELATPEVAERLRATLQHVKRAQHEVRGVMSQLQGERTSEPLAERVRREILMAQDSLGFAPGLSVDDWGAASAAVELDPTLSDDIVAVIRELLSNVARHSKATSVAVTLSASEGRLAVVIVDDGIGPAGATTRHSGTSNLANRALRRSGTFRLVAASKARERPGTRAEWNVAVK